MQASQFPVSRIPENGIVIEFPEANARQASQLAQELQAKIKNALVDGRAAGSASIEKVDEKALDLGTVLAIVLGANATIAVAAGIADWMRRTHTKVRIRKPDGTEVDIGNVLGTDAAAIVAALEKKDGA